MSASGNPVPLDEGPPRGVASLPAEFVRESARGLSQLGADVAHTLAPYLRLDLPVAVVLAVFVFLFAPLVPRNTENPQLLAAYSNDEPFLTMALEATLARPYGNPGAYFDPHNPAFDDVPDHWGEKRYPNITYYGGAMFMLALPPYAALRAVGVPSFPTGPVVLRTITLLAAVLSILILYNLGRARGSRVVGLLGAVWIATDPSFLYYATFIHPDTLQMLFGLCAFLVAVVHLRSGTATSLVALGVFCGLVQGAKAGGPWTVPMALAAVWFGAPRFGIPVLKRVLVLAISALAGFFLSTPYAFVDGYYRRSMEIAYDIVSRSTLNPGESLSLWTWTETVYHYLGPLAVGLVAVTALRAVVLTARRRPDAALNLALVVALSQLFWYGISGKLWHVPGYLILSFGLLAVFAVETLWIALRYVVGLIPRPRVRGIAFAVASVAVVVTVIDGRWFVPVSWAVDQHTSVRSTVRQANDWAIENQVPGDSAIVFDDLAYFDPERFTNATLHGGVLTWPVVERRDPDYIVLSSSLYGAAWMQNLIRTQRLTRRDPDPFNVSLYQDLLPAAPGSAPLRGIELAAVLRPTTRRPEPWTGELAQACEHCDLRLVDLRDQLAWIADLERRVRVLGRRNEPLIGPELRIYEVGELRVPAGSARG